MKTFEEKWTAWLDGELAGPELAEFEASLPDKAAAEAEKLDAQKLRTFLKEHLPCRAMGNEEFFHHQLREQIAADAGGVRPRESDEGGRVWWPIRRLVWVGTTALAIFGMCAFFVMREKPATEQSQYLSQILTARVDPVVSPNATISMFESKEDRVTVLWVEGLKSLPSEFASSK
jgi:anti-sigma factor RsiW